MEIHLEIAKHDKKRLNPIFATIKINYVRRSFVNNYHFAVSLFVITKMVVQWI